METWKELNVYVHYSPSDPGINNIFCDKSTFAREDLTIGQRLAYENTGGLFGSITLKAFNDETATVTYRGTDYILKIKQSRELDQGGRDYTNFWLSVQLV